MDLSEFMNIILGGGLVGTVATIGSLRATVRKAKAEAMKAEAGAEAMRIDNAEHATRILMENIVKPLKDEFCETKKELARNTREMARLRKAIAIGSYRPIMSMHSTNSTRSKLDIKVLFPARKAR